MNSEVKKAIEILKGEYGMEITPGEEIQGMPDPHVAGCVLIGLMKAEIGVVVYTEDHFDEYMRGEYEVVDNWDRAKVMLERWNAGLDGEALLF